MPITVRHDFTSLDSAQAVITALLKDKKLTSPSEIKRFLHPPPPALPALRQELQLKLSLLKQARQLIQTHLERGNDILVYGDYDADGITATAILWSTLTRLARHSQARILPFIPDRVRHGYGLSSASLREINSGAAFAASAYPDFHPALVITVDTGITAVKATQLLQKRGLAVIITDHHQPGKTLPPAQVILHSLNSSGAGLAWTIALYLTASHPDTYRLIGLAALGIVADQIPLTGINRDLVSVGLKELGRSRAPGLVALKRLAGLTGKSLSAYDINFILAPRLNAAGRLANGTEALRLLCTRNPRQAASLARLLHSLNEERQALTASGIAEALTHSPRHHLIISSSSRYHEGVVGLIAGRLVERYHRPALAISIGRKIAKGSARSVKGVNITALLRHFEGLFESLGGHELAAGFSLLPDKLEELKDKLLPYSDQVIDSSLLSRSSSATALLTLSQTSLTLARLLQKFQPFGIGNFPPRFLTRNLQVIEDRRLGKEGKHRRLTVAQNGVSRQAIWFGAQAGYPLHSIKELVYTLDINLWRSRESLQLVVKHANF